MTQSNLSPALAAFVERVIVPALLERWLREHASLNTPERPAA